MCGCSALLSAKRQFIVLKLAKIVIFSAPIKAFSACLQDHSYYCCIDIKGSFDEVTTALSSMTSPDTGIVSLLTKLRHTLFHYSSSISCLYCWCCNITSLK